MSMPNHFKFFGTNAQPLNQSQVPTHCTPIKNKPTIKINKKAITPRAEPQINHITFKIFH